MEYGLEMQLFFCWYRG